MNKDLFEHIGLTEKEAEVYQILLKLGESPVSDILKETDDHSQIIYRAIDGLVAKELAFVSIKRHRKYVRAENPRVLQQMEEEKLAEIRKLIPDLLALQKAEREVIVKVYQGNEGIRSIRDQAIESIPEGGTYYNFGASGDRFYEIMGERLQDSERKRIKKKIWKKVVTYSSQKEMTLKNNAKFMEYSEFRFLPEKYPAPSSTSIYNDTVAIFIFQPEPLVITIEHTEVAKSYLNYFKSLWKVAKE